jgi:hypothetical protein
MDELNNVRNGRLLPMPKLDQVSSWMSVTWGFELCRLGAAPVTVGGAVSFLLLLTAV